MSKFDVALNALNALIEEATIANDEEYKSKDKYPHIMQKWQNGQNWIEAQDNAIRTALTQAAEIERGDKVVVPREPSNKMLSAMADRKNERSVYDSYKAMITASEGK